MEERPYVPLSQQEMLEANIFLFCETSAIPLRNRSRYLLGADFDWEKPGKYRHIEVDELAFNLGTDVDTIWNVVHDLKAPPEMYPTDAFQNHVLTHGLSIVVAEELKWRQSYADLDAEVTVPVMAGVLGVGYRVVKRIMDASGVKPRITDHANYYPKELMYRARAEIMAFPRAGDKKPLQRIVGRVGCSIDWAKARINDNVSRDLMWSGNGSVQEHFEDDFETKLINEYSKIAGNAPETMRTEDQIAAELGRDVAWVRPRLLRFHSKKVDLPARKGVLRSHYDESVYQSLKEESERKKSLPPRSESQIIIKELARMIGVNHVTAESALARLGVKLTACSRADTGGEIAVCEVEIVPAVAKNIMEDRQKRLKEFDKLINYLSNKPVLSEDEKKALWIARRQRGSLLKPYERIKKTYENLIQQSEIQN